MRKVKAFLFAAAAMTMTFVSCSKDESVDANDIHVTFEQNEIMDGVKSHLVFDSENGNFIPVWDNGDIVKVYDNNDKSAQYVVHIENGEMYLTHSFDHYSTGGQYDPNSDLFYCAFPESIGKGRNGVVLPRHQTTNDGAVRNFPMFAKGNVNDFTFKNLCGLVRLKLTGVVALDSISITTDKYLNGKFNVDVVDGAPVMSCNTESNLIGASKTTTLRFTEAFQLNTVAKVAEIYIPAGQYNLFTLTFYANGQKYELRKDNGLSISRTTYATFALDLTSATFEDFVEGSTNALFNMDATGSQKCYIAKGNVQYVGGTNTFWRVADNGFDCFGTFQISAYLVNNIGPKSHDRDIFCWGANTYKDANGGMVHSSSNGVNIYPSNAQGASRKWYALTSTDDLTGDNEWANNGLVNIDNTWKTPSADQMNAILANNTTFMTTISGLNVTGLVIIPGLTTTLATPSSMTANEWRIYEMAGAAFLPVMYTHNVSGGAVVSGMSYYWTRSVVDADNAKALSLSTSNVPAVIDVAKKVGGYVRLIKVVE